MKAKTYLREIKRLDVICKQKAEEIQLIREQAMCVPAQTIKPDLIQTSPDGQGFTRLIDRAVTLESEIKKDIDTLQAERHKRIAQIQQMDNIISIDVLYQRYVLYKPLQDIAEYMGLSYGHVRNIHGVALNEFQRKFL